MKLTPEQVTNFIEANIETQFKLFSAICEDEKTVHMVTYGYDLEFPIYYEIDGKTFKYYESKKVSIAGKTYKITQYWEEINKRRAEMIKTILEAQQQDPIEEKYGGNNGS